MNTKSNPKASDARLISSTGVPTGISFIVFRTVLAGFSSGKRPPWPSACGPSWPSLPGLSAHKAAAELKRRKIARRGGPIIFLPGGSWGSPRWGGGFGGGGGGFGGGFSGGGGWSGGGGASGSW
jgi:uncharacterized membrane protein YgcG